MALPPIDPAAISPRRTFLFRHIADELARTDDILALEAIRQRIQLAYNAWCAQRDKEPNVAEFESLVRQCHWLQPHTFFYERKPDVRIFHDVPVVGVVNRDRHTSLTALLASMPRKPGIVLRTRSGAGKTIACRRAFFDCLYRGKCILAGREEDEATLHGFIPCLLDLSKLPITDDLLEDTDHCMLRLLGHLANMDQPLPSLVVRRWIEVGPPLLIFCDLNGLRPDRRDRFADAVISFLKLYERFGHRWVITYRSTGSEENDPVLNTLQDFFTAYDLVSFPYHLAKNYLASIQRYEAGVQESADFKGLKNEFRELELVIPEESEIDAETEQRLDAIGQYACGDGSLISTPLLMHFLAQINPQLRPHIKSLADIYHHVVTLHLTRDRQLYLKDIPRTLQGKIGLKRIRSALTRLSLAMHHESVTRWATDDLGWLFAKPSASVSRWRPIGDFWRNGDVADSDYYTEIYDDNEIESIKVFSFLRTDGNEVAFLHDSMIDYFAGAVALGQYLGPNMPPLPRGESGPSRVRCIPTGDPWYTAVAQLFASDPNRWQKAAGFLAGAMTCDEVVLLAIELLYQSANRELVELFQQVLRARPREPDHLLKQMETTILRRGSWIFSHPQNLIELIFDDLIGDQPLLKK